MIATNYLLGKPRRALPTFVQHKSAQPAATSTYTITPDATPADGNLMIVMFGGLQSRTVNSNPSGWNNLYTSAGAGVNEVWYKVASSESGSYVWTWSGGTLQGGYTFLELGNTDVSATFSQQLVPGSGAISSLSFNSLDIYTPAVAVAFCVGNSNTWTINNSFSNVFSNTLWTAGYKIYTPVVTVSETVTMSGTTTTTKRGFIQRFYGTRIT